MVIIFVLLFIIQRDRSFVTERHFAVCVGLVWQGSQQSSAAECSRVQPRQVESDTPATPLRLTKLHRNSAQNKYPKSAFETSKSVELDAIGFDSLGPCN